MPKNKIVAAGLFVIAIAMIYLGVSAGILPPTLTGVGFLLMVWYLL